MSVEVPDRLVFCPNCGVFLRCVDDRLTVKLHNTGGRLLSPECPGTGAAGHDIGPRVSYWFTHLGDALYRGTTGEETFGVYCESCDKRFSPRRPPDGAFHRDSPVRVKCPGCNGLFRLGDLREGPNGIWLPR